MNVLARALAWDDTKKRWLLTRCNTAGSLMTESSIDWSSWNKHVTLDYPLGTNIDPRLIRTLTAADVVTIQEPLSVDDNGSSLTVDATDLDIRNLSSVNDSVTAVATDLDIRNLSSTQDSVEVKQATAANLLATVTQADSNRVVTDITKTATLQTVQATLSGNTTLWDPAASKKVRLKYIQVFNSGSANITVALRFGSAGTLRFTSTLAANTGWNMNLIGCNWEGAADEILYVNLSAAGTVDVTVLGEEI
jgi:hypothetical protein